MPTRLEIPRSIGEVLERTLQKSPVREALVASDRRLSYAELDAAADKAASGLHQLGVRAGDVVAVSLPNAAEVVVTFHAVARLGAVWLGINRNLAPAEKRFILSDADAAVMVADENTAEPLSRDSPAQVIAAGDWNQVCSAAGTSYPRATPGSDDLAGIAYTSGTTGRPKGVMHSHRNLLLPGAALAAAREYGGDLRRGDCAALTILNLQVTSTLLAMQAGGTQVVMDRTDSAGIADWIRRERITSWFGVPTMLHGLVHDPTITPEALASLQDVWTGGTFAPESILRDFEERFSRRVHVTYGLTELPTVATIEERGQAHVPLSSGRPLPHLAVEIVGIDGNVLPPGEVGEVAIRGRDADSPYHPMLGYLGAPTATAAAVRDGVLYTGDVGTIDDHGELFIRDRRHAVILRGGANVYPAEVERVLIAHPRVAGAAVVAIPDERLGQLVAAAVELVEPGSIDDEELRRYCLDELARYKVPERWVMAQLPRNAMGKVVRVEVESWFAANAGDSGNVSGTRVT
jgi:acyl-CoA synthetase (AMP-forming)/AMP-acid ligase II